MIKATVNEVRDAFRALRRINEEVRLKHKAAWRVARLLNKLKSALKDFEEAQLKLFTDAGGVPEGNGITLREPVRGKDMADLDWNAAMQAHKDKVTALGKELKALGMEEVEIDYDPIPCSLFDDDMKVSANDLADAGRFLTE